MMTTFADVKYNTAIIHTLLLQIYFIIQDGLHHIFPEDQLVPGEDNDLDEQTHPDVPHKVTLCSVQDLPSN